MPPPVYTTSPNTPTSTSTIGCNGLSQNLQLNSNNNYNTSNYYLNGSDPSPNGSQETAQSDLWMMKNELLMADAGQQQQQILPQSHYGTQEMINGLTANAYQQQFNTYGSPIDYTYSYYTGNRPEEYQPLATAEDNYNMNVKNSLCKYI